MHFRKWLGERDLAKLGKRLGVTKSMVSLLKNGKRRPSLALALKIERLTGGVVSVSEWKVPSVKRRGEAR